MKTCRNEKNRSEQFFNLLHELYCTFIRIKAKITFCILFVDAINKDLHAFLVGNHLSFKLKTSIARCSFVTFIP